MKKRAYAKINLGIKVVGVLDGGYHDLEMVMSKINLYDTLIFKKCDRLKVECPFIKEEDNLVYKIAKYLKEEYKVDKGIYIKIIKRIPMEAGLGGGSSDAAVAIKTLNELWDLKLSKDDMINISTKFGSDIAFFINDKTAFVSGRGEKIEDIKSSKLKLLLIKPDFGCSTKEIYSNISEFSKKGELTSLIKVLSEEDLEGLSKEITNDLEKGLKEKKQDIDFIKKDLISYGALASLMSGSGSTVFGIFDSNKTRKEAYKELKMFYDIINVETI